MPRRSRPLMDACLSMAGPMAERCQGFVEQVGTA
jgi:hypothetical protein